MCTPHVLHATWTAWGYVDATVAWLFGLDESKYAWAVHEHHRQASEVCVHTDRCAMVASHGTSTPTDPVLVTPATVPATHTCHALCGTLLLLLVQMQALRCTDLEGAGARAS